MINGRIPAGFVFASTFLGLGLFGSGAVLGAEEGASPSSADSSPSEKEAVDEPLEPAPAESGDSSTEGGEATPPLPEPPPLPEGGEEGAPSADAAGKETAPENSVADDSPSSGAETGSPEDSPNDAMGEEGDTAIPGLNERPQLNTTKWKKPEDRVFGTYRVRLMFGQPKFGDGLKFYDELYGSPNWYPTLAADWFAWDWYATLGLGFRGSYYTAEGYAAKDTGVPLEDLTEDDVVKDKNGETALTFLPMQFVATAEFTPFSKKWVVIDGWAGVERLYFQETRTRSGTRGSSSSSAMFLVQDDDDGNSDDGGDEDESLVNTGWKTSSVVGVSANFLLNPLDETSVNSMRSVMGLGYVYLSPFMEIVRSLDEDGATFDREVYGVGFTFESVY